MSAEAVLSRLSRSDRHALNRLAQVAGTSAEAMAASLLVVHIRALRAEHQALDGSSVVALAQLANRLGVAS